MHPQDLGWHAMVACNKLKDLKQDTTVRLARIMDRLDGGNRCNRLPCDHRAAILRTGKDTTHD